MKITQDKDSQTIRVTLLLSNAIKHLIIEICEEQSAVSKWPLPACCISTPVNRKTRKLLREAEVNTRAPSFV